MIAAPATATTRPRSCGSSSGSCSRTAAVATANSGARLPSVEVITGPSARFEAKVRQRQAARKNRPMAMKSAGRAQTTVRPRRISGDSREDRSVRRDADRGPRQRSTDPRQLRQNDPGAQEEGRSKGVEDGCGHEVRLGTPLRGARLAVPSLFDAVSGALPIRLGGSALRPACHSGARASAKPGVSSLLNLGIPGPARCAVAGMTKNKDLTWRPINCCFSPATASAPK